MTDPPQTNDLIAFSISDSYVVVPFNDIICCQADGGYTRVSLQGRDDLLLTKGLSKLEASLPEGIFVRVHNNTLVNLLHVRLVLKGDESCVVLSNGTKVNLAERRRKGLMGRLKVF